MGNPATVIRKKTEKRRKKYEARLGPGVYLPKDERLKVNAAVEKHLAEKKVTSAANRKAWQVLGTWTKPFLCAFSDGDPVTRGGDRAFQSRVPGTKDQPHTTIAGGGHFLQEDKGEELARVVVDFVAKS